MYKKSKYAWLEHLDFMFVDLIALLISFTVAYVFKFGDFGFIQSLNWLRLILLFSGLDVIITLVKNPYGGIFNRPYYMEMIRALQLAFYNLISVALLLYIFKIGENYSRTVFIVMYVLYFLLSLIMKYIWRKLIVSGRIHTYNSKPISLFIIGRKDSIASTMANVSSGDLFIYDIKGIHFTDDCSDSEFNGIPVVGEGYADHIIKSNISDILIAVRPSDVGDDVYRKLIGNAVNVHIDIESVFGVQTEEQFIADVGVLKTLSVGAFDFKPRHLIYLMVKRILDFFIGVIGVLFLIPLTIVIKLVSLLSGDRDSIFYTQKRIGLNGKPIKIYKYRTMVKDADNLLAELLKDEKYRREWEANQKLRNDPRITKVGRILRKLSIDEFPQFINIVKGDMSLVGPRPLIEGELEMHGGLKLYQKLKPGITGWWGCNGRSNIEYRERLELEYYYVKNFSMYLDILCVFRTMLALIKKDGAE